MLECAFIFNLRRRLSFWILLALFGAMSSTQVWAVDPPLPQDANKVDAPEEDDFRQTPYTQYGEFNSDEDEAEDTKFFQYGRFYGVSLGVGYEGATGNKGTLYNGGLPAFEFKVQYWFDFNLALTLGVYTVKHSFIGVLDADAAGNANTPASRHEINIFKVGADLKYYIDTKDLSAAITFAGPYLTAGFGSYSRTLTDSAAADSPDQETSLGFNFGGGLEFTLKPKKTYFNLESKFHVVNFQGDDSGVNVNGTQIANHNGMYLSVMGAFLFTW